MRPFIFFSCLILSFSLQTHAAEKTKDSDSNTYLWDLSAIYADEAAWKADMEKVKQELPEMKKCQGHLGDSPEKLKACLDLNFKISKIVSRGATWAGLKKSDDLLNQKNVENLQLSEDFGANVGKELSFISPEVASIGRTQIEKMESKLPALNEYKQYLRVILDQKDHLLDTPREELLATLGPVLYASSEIQPLLLSSDISWKSVKLSDGKTYSVNQTVYEKFRESPNRADRLKVFTAFYEVLTQFQNTLGESLGTAVKYHVTSAKIRSYPNALAQAMDADKIPEEVYRTLIKQVNLGLPVYHAYLNHLKKNLGLKTMDYADAYAPGNDVKESFPVERAKKTVLEAVAPLGPEYQKKLASAFESRWMDVYPRKGKGTGGFMNPAATEVHPYLLLNHQDNFSSTSTLAHEWGHAMHSVYSITHQPYQYSDYSTFVAEIASITNEVLLREYLIKNAKNKKEKSYYLEELMKLIRTTFFRQSQFAEFELRLHEEIESGSALSGQKMSDIYGEIARKYYGQKEGVLNFDKKYFSEWAFIPHFYGGFYVYQYATSIAAAFYFAENILAGKPDARDKYLTVLQSGSSKYPYEILMDAGVDMKSPEVYQAVVARMKSAIEELKQNE